MEPTDEIVPGPRMSPRKPHISVKAYVSSLTKYPHHHQLHRRVVTYVVEVIERLFSIFGAGIVSGEHVMRVIWPGRYRLRLTNVDSLVLRYSSMSTWSPVPITLPNPRPPLSTPSRLPPNSHLSVYFVSRHILHDARYSTCRPHTRLGFA